MTSNLQFSRRTVRAAVGVLAPDTHAGFDDLRGQFGLEDTDAGEGRYLEARRVSLTDFCLRYPAFETPYGPLAAAVVGAASEVVSRRIDWLDRERYAGKEFNVSFDIELVRSLERDGFVLDRSGLRRALPEQLDLPAADNEVHQLLDRFSLTTPKGHLDQAVDAHTRGNWAGSNGQLRAFLESLLDDLAERLHPTASGTPSGHARRRFLAKLSPPFLFGDLNEWTPDGKNFIEGTFKRLHPQGAHPGLSDEEDATFRLHIVLILARLLLKRFAARQP